MKKVKELIIIASIVLVSGHYGFGQQKVFHQVEELYKKGVNFTKSTGLLQPVNTTIAQGKVKSAATYQLIEEQLQAITTTKPNYLELQLPYKDSVYTLSLYQVELYKKNTQINTPSTSNIPFQKGIHYRGIVKGNPNSLVSFNVYETTCAAVISIKGVGNLVLGKSKDSTAQSIYVMYNDKEIPNTFQCKIKKDSDDKVEKKSNRLDSAPRCVGLYFELTNDIFIENNSNINTTMQWLATLFNSVQTLYANDAVQVAISNVFIWTEHDPYQVSENTYDALDLFVSNRPVFQGDLGQLISSDALGGGLAYVDRLCDENLKHSYSDASIFYEAFPLYSFTIHAITHEFGHLLGSSHTQSCVWNGNNTAIDGCVEQEGDCAPAPVPAEGGTIMSYCHVNDVGINFANGFGVQPRTLIQNKIENALCLSLDCENYCFDSIASLNIAPSLDRATITWGDFNNNNTQISVRPFNTTTENWVTTGSSLFVANGLLPNSYYMASVRYSCTNGFQWNEEKVFVTHGDYCSGITLTDSGGATDNYTDNEHIIRVIQPQNPQNTIQLNFTQLDLEEEYDFLYIYNGSSTQATELTGGLTGLLEPFSVQSTAPDGALTLEFISDYIVNNSGYQATVVCSGLNTEIPTEFLDFTYWPNPTAETVAISSNTTIQKIEIYDIRGVIQRTDFYQSNWVEVDLAELPTGNYIAKLYFEGSTSTIKLVKK